MPTLDEEIKAQEDALAALRQQKVNETDAPVSKKFIEDVISGTVGLNTDTVAKECVNIKAKGITFDMDEVDGKWATITLPIGTPSPDNALLHGIAAELYLCGGQRVDLNGDVGPIEIRCHHREIAKVMHTYEGRL